MELVLGVLVVTWLMSKAVSAAKLDHSFAKQGLVSPRLEAKYGSKERAQAKCAKYGFFSHLRDAWRDYWPRRTEALIAARDARTADGTSRVRLRDRLAAAKRWIDTKRTATTDPQPKRKVAEAGNPLADEFDEPFDADYRFDDDEIDPAGAADEPSPTPAPKPTYAVDPSDEPVDEPATTPEPATPAPANGGTTVSAPTGEVVNYETNVAEIQAQIADVTRRIDLDNAALAALANAKAAVDAMQQTYQQAAIAAQTKLDHQAAKNLDGTTLGHAGTLVDAMPIGAVDRLFDEIEAVEALIRDRLASDEMALAALEAELAHINATYADANDVVAGNLGGDSSYLDSSGGQATAAPAPAPAPQPAAA